MSWFKNCVLSFICALGVAVPLVASAAEAPPTGFSIFAVEIKPGSQGQFEEFILKFKQAADQLGNPPSWYASSPGVGQDNIYTFASPFNSFGELAEQRPILQEVYDEAEVMRLFGLYSNSVVRTETFLVHPRPDLSRPSPPMDNPAEITLTLGITIDPAKTEAYETYVKQLAEATDKTAKDAYWNTYIGGIGSAAGTYGVRIPMNWVDLDTPVKPFSERLNEAFGKRKGEKILAAGEAVGAKIEYAIRRNRADLSHIAK